MKALIPIILFIGLFFAWGFYIQYPRTESEANKVRERDSLQAVYDSMDCIENPTREQLRTHVKVAARKYELHLDIVDIRLDRAFFRSNKKRGLKKICCD